MIKCEVKQDEVEVKKKTKVVMTKQTDTKYFNASVISITEKGVCISSVFPKNFINSKNFYRLLASLLSFEVYGIEKLWGIRSMDVE